MEWLLQSPLLLFGFDLKFLRKYSYLLNFGLLREGNPLVNMTHMITLWKWAGGFQKTGHEVTEWQGLNYFYTLFARLRHVISFLHVIPKQPQKLLESGSRVLPKGTWAPSWRYWEAGGVGSLQGCSGRGLWNLNLFLFPCFSCLGQAANSFALCLPCCATYCHKPKSN